MLPSTPRVALFSTNFLAYSQTFIHDELRHHERYEVDVFCQRRMNAERFPWPRVHTPAATDTLAGRARAAWARATTLSPAFWRTLARGDYGLLHAHFGPGSVYTLPYHLGLKIPTIVTVHGYDVPLLLTRRRYRPKFWRYWAASPLLLRTVDRWLAASNELRDMLLELGAPPERVHVWRLGVVLPPRTSPPAPTSPRRVLMVGRFVEKKGFAYGIEAFARQARAHPDVELRIAGGGALEPELRAQVARLGLDDRVRFLGVLDHADVLSEMAQAYALVAPSVVAAGGDRESGLIVVKEAAARSVPAVGTLHGGIPEIIDDGATGFLVPERDVATLSDRLGRLLADPDLRARMGEAARDKMEAEYDVAERVRALETHYDQVLAAAAGR